MLSVDRRARRAAESEEGARAERDEHVAAPHVRRPAALGEARDVLAMQRLAGNQATAALLQRRRGGGTQAVAPRVTAQQAAALIHDWFVQHPPSGQAVNYCTGLAASGDIYISKVNGVTEKTKYLDALAEYIVANGLDDGRDIHLAQKFNTGVGSNHAEACIMAAAAANGDTLSVIYCSGPHCAFCGELMKKAGITLGAANGTEHQQGWAHPFAPISFGSQSGETSGQLAILKALPLHPTEQDAERVGAKWLSTPPEGRSTQWL